MSNDKHLDVLGESHLPDDIWTPTEGENYGLDGYPDMDYGSGVLHGNPNVSETVPRMDEGVLADIVDGAPDGQVFGPLGDIADMMKQSSLPDLTWLEVDEQDATRLPVNPVDQSIPELEEAWGVDRRSDGVHLIPNVDLEKAAYEKALKDGDVRPVRTRAALLNIVRKAMRRSAAGVPFEDIEAEVQETLGDDLPLVQKHLQLIRDGHDLSGRVFIHADAYPGCANGDWTEAVKKVASGSRYVVAGSSCANCVQNLSGSCSVFKKKLVASVPWDDALEHYSPELEAAGRKVASGNPKAALRAAFAQAPEGMGFIQRHKPVHVTPSERISAEEAHREVQAAKTERRVYTPADKQEARKLHAARIRVARWVQQGLLDKTAATRIVAQANPKVMLEQAVSRMVASNGSAAYSGLVNDTRAPDMAGDEAWERLGSVAPLPAVKLSRAQVHKQIARWARTGLLDKGSVQKLARSLAEPRDVLRTAAILASATTTGEYSGAVNNMHGTEVSQDHAWKLLREAEDHAAKATAAIVAEVERREFQASRAGKHMARVQVKVAKIEEAINRGVVGRNLLNLIQETIRPDDHDMAIPLLDPILQRTGALEKEIQTVHDYSGVDNKRASEDVTSADAWKHLFTTADVAQQKAARIQESRTARVSLTIERKVVQVKEAIERGARGQALRKIIARTFLKDEIPQAATLLNPLLEKTGALSESSTQEYQGAKFERAVGRKAEAVPLPKEVRGVLRWARQKMSEGNVGNQLDELLSMRFSPRVLTAAQGALQDARGRHEGLAGILYVDASAYASERGTKGCEHGAVKHRANTLKAVLQMDRCASCSLRNVGSDGTPRCQTYKKALISELTPEEASGLQAENIRMANAPDQEVTASLFTPMGNLFNQAEFSLSSGEYDDISVEDAPDIKKLGDVLFGGLHLSED